MFQFLPADERKNDLYIDLDEQCQENEIYFLPLHERIFLDFDETVPFWCLAHKM